MDKTESSSFQKLSDRLSKNFEKEKKTRFKTFFNQRRRHRRCQVKMWVKPLDQSHHITINIVALLCMICCVEKESDIKLLKSIQIYSHECVVLNRQNFDRFLGETGNQEMFEIFHTKKFHFFPFTVEVSKSIKKNSWDSRPNSLT